MEFNMFLGMYRSNIKINIVASFVKYLFKNVPRNNTFHVKPIVGLLYIFLSPCDSEK